MASAGMARRRGWSPSGLGGVRPRVPQRSSRCPLSGRSGAVEEPFLGLGQGRTFIRGSPGPGRRVSVHSTCPPPVGRRTWVRTLSLRHPESLEGGDASCDTLRPVGAWGRRAEPQPAARLREPRACPPEAERPTHPRPPNPCSLPPRSLLSVWGSGRRTEGTAPFPVHWPLP